MGKLIFVFLAVCLVSTFTSSSAATHGLDIGLSHDTYSNVNYLHDDNTDLYVALAQGAFDFFANLVRAKTEILLWLEGGIIQLLVRGFSNLRHVMIHNADFVHGIITTIAELMKILLTNKPHLGVAHVQKIVAEATNEYIGIGHGHY